MLPADPYTKQITRKLLGRSVDAQRTSVHSFTGNRQRRFGESRTHAATTLPRDCTSTELFPVPSGLYLILFRSSCEDDLEKRRSTSLAFLSTRSFVIEDRKRLGTQVGIDSETYLSYLMTISPDR